MTLSPYRYKISTNMSRDRQSDRNSWSDLGWNAGWDSGWNSLDTEGASKDPPPTGSSAATSAANGPTAAASSPVEDTNQTQIGDRKDEWNTPTDTPQPSCSGDINSVISDAPVIFTPATSTACSVQGDDDVFVIDGTTMHHLVRSDRADNMTYNHKGLEFVLSGKELTLWGEKVTSSDGSLLESVAVAVPSGIDPEAVYLHEGTVYLSPALRHLQGGELRKLSLDELGSSGSGSMWNSRVTNPRLISPNGRKVCIWDKVTSPHPNSSQAQRTLWSIFG